MIRSKYWYKVPSITVVEALKKMTWSRTADQSAAGEIAALMVYVALIFSSEIDDGPPEQGHHMAAASYDDLQTATSLSRKLVANGVSRLVELKLIIPEGSHQKRRYRIAWNGGTGWFKLPCQAIVREQKILPFAHFTLRTKHELHAMKLHLYLASCRSNDAQFSMASYETIYEKIGIPERDIRKAISLLVATGLLRSVDRKHEAELKEFGPNQYYLVGFNKLPGYAGDGQVAA
ncbi:hypothetical protein J2X19_005152 [Rhodoferax ferrireducens]|uniref:Replication protein n=1 Tax=Rhodoferax ferrireducens TaxID=192843 RepID=A0ABU2CGJ8_9BURK|nr:hypothetical protein [Rhodoferax ferrireducens]MDR7380445.1 hypothetical protein [Rhodoferax ferrireducens]